jgi:MerR family transcriptional regulator, light-induced transcriptional regulator
LNQFTIRDIEHLTGIKAHTLRIWEQRYKIALSKRKDSNHRFYDNNDLKNILRIARLYHSGVKISKIAKLSAQEIETLLLATVPGDNYYEIYINRMVEAMIDFDQLKFEEICHTALLHAGFEKYMIKVIYPYLERVGLLWMTGNIIPAQEHFSSNLIINKIILAIDGLPVPEHIIPHYLLFLPKNEYHEIPLLFACYLLKKNGKKVTYFGANVTVTEISPFIRQKNITHLFTHIITNFTHQEVDQYVTDLLENFPDLQIILAGPQNQYIQRALPDNFTVLRSLGEMVEYTQS